jgi:hypothetical protein
MAVTLNNGEAEVFARATLALNYDAPDKPAPITETQARAPRRSKRSARPSANAICKAA